MANLKRLIAHVHEGASCVNAMRVGVLLAAMFCSSSTVIQAAAVVIDHDTTIDAVSPISGSSIQVIDGPDGPTSVGIVSGGTVAGFDGQENSTITLDGGAITFLSSLQDNATFIMRSGQFACTELVCSVIDYSTFFRAYDSSTLHFFGGMLDGIELNDSSVAHVYGKDLSLVIFDQIAAYVEGTYINGDPVNVSFKFRPDIDTHVILHNIPEPSEALAIIALAYVFLRRVMRRDRPLSFNR